MREPLNDEEIEHLKTTTDIIGTPDNVLRLIATVEHKQKVMETALVNWDMETGKRQKLEKENANLKATAKELSRINDNLFKENAKLTKTILSLTTENENRLQEIYKLRKPIKNDRRQHDLDYAARAPERRGR